MNTKFEKAIAQIDQKNSKDLNFESFEGKDYPKALLYSQRMTQMLLELQPNASQALQIAARAQHICRWKIPRKEYPMDKAGYFNWRNDLKKMHAGMTAEILNNLAYETQFIERVSFLITKKLIKKDPDTQTLEDVACLVFLKYYFEVFASKHNDEKIINILQKTWRKMSDLGHAAALKLNLSTESLNLIHKAVA